MIDTHCHIYLPEFEADIEAVISRAEQVGVNKFYLPAIDSHTNEAMFRLEQQFPGKCIAMAGLHPCYVKENYEEELKVVADLLAKRKFAAIGEIGLDFYWDKTFTYQQYKALEIQVSWALQYQLPIVLHTRNATMETFDAIKKYCSSGLKGIFHCFGGTLEEARMITEAGFLLGIGGVVTYKNAGLAETLSEIDLKYLVLETDAPYLTPVPHRGKRNESAYLRLIAQKIAEVKGCTIEEVESVTTRNAEELFANVEG